MGQGHAQCTVYTLRQNFKLTRISPVYSRQCVRALSKVLVFDQNSPISFQPFYLRDRINCAVIRNQRRERFIQIRVRLSSIFLYLFINVIIRRKFERISSKVYSFMKNIIITIGENFTLVYYVHFSKIILESFINLIYIDLHLIFTLQKLKIPVN